MQTLLIDHSADVSLITLNRPERRNAITFAMVEELLAALDECERRGVRVVILTGAGPAFCSGMDLEMLRAIQQQGHQQNLVESRRLAHLFQRLYEFPAPTVAAVNGAAVAGGCGLASVCDFTLSVPDAKFGYPEVRIGFLPALVSVYLLRQVGEKRARDLLLSGRLIDGHEAAAWGLVTRLVEPDQLLTAARELAADLLHCSPGSLAASKRLLARLPMETIESGLDLAAQENAALRQTPDFREGISAFLEKRAPQWAPARKGETSE